MFHLEDIQPFLVIHSSYAWAMVFAFAFMESLVVVGSIVSAAILFSICVYLYHAQILSMYLIVPTAVCGAHLGDVLSFVIGTKMGPRLLQRSFFQRHAEKVEKGRNFIARFGSYAVILGRFTPGLRPIIPFLLGVSNWDGKRFYGASVMAVLAWGVGLIVLTIGVEQLL